MSKRSNLLWGMMLGAGAMYFWDPQNGSRRKAKLRERIFRLQAQSDTAIESAIFELREKAAQSLSMNIGNIEQRVQARLRYLTPHANAIQVHQEGQRIILEGDILDEYLEPVLNELAAIPGVTAVEHHLNVYTRTEDFPDLLETDWALSPASAWMLTPTARLLMAAGGVYLFLYGVMRGGVAGLLAEVGSAYLGIRAFEENQPANLEGKIVVDPEGTASMKRPKTARREQAVPVTGQDRQA